MKTIHILLALLTCTHALLTFEAIRNLTALQIELKHRIRDFRLVAEGLGQEGGKGSEEVVLADTYLDLENDGELELTIAAALHTLNLAILLQLEKPMPRDPAEGRRERPECAVVVREYHDFLAATIRLVALVRDYEVVRRWGGESAVFVEVAYLQALWASRKTNKRERSFIEQQLELYEYRHPDSCWGMGNEVLRRSVEVVEFLNDLLDEFR